MMLAAGLLLQGCLWGYYGDADDTGPPDGDGGACSDQFWRDADGDLYGDDADTVQACEAPDGYVAAGEVDCDDGDGTVHPGAEELCGDGLDNDCDPQTINPDCELGDRNLSDADAIFAVDRDDAKLGDQVEICGDLFGQEGDLDGVPDLALAAPAEYDDTERGSVYIMDGTLRGLIDPDSSARRIRVRTGSNSNQLGNSLACRGDIDGDGITDLVVAANYEDTSGVGLHAGRVAIHLGPISDNPYYDVDLDGIQVADMLIDGDNAEGLLGTAMHQADIDGDSRSDLFVTEPGYLDTEGDRIGVVHLFMGATLAGRSQLTVADARASFFGAAVATAYGDRGSVTTADFTGDGLPDVALAAQQQDRSGSDQDEGRVYIVPDVDGLGVVSLALNELPGFSIRPEGFANENFGATTIAGDLNGDGQMDLVVLTQLPLGAAWVFDLSTVTEGEVLGHDDAWTWFDRADADDCGGLAADARGDVNGDGAVDFVFDAHCSDIAGENGAGRVWGFYGPVTDGAHKTTDDSDFTFYTEAQGANLGRSLSTADDIDGDGIADILTAAPFYGGTGRVGLFLGTGQ